MQPATRSRTALSTSGLSIRFGRGTRRAPFIDALRDVEMTCASGEILGLLGPNGSGKTTLFRVLCGELTPRSGSATVLDRVPGDPNLVTRVGYQPEGPVPFPQLGARELLLHLGALMRLPSGRAQERADRLFDELGLTPIADRRIRALSTGMQKRLALAAAMLADPELLLLDEPTSGLDPFGSRIVLEVLRASAARGTAILLSSHRLDEVEEVCDRVVLLHRGRQVAEGTLDALLGTGTEALEMCLPTPDLKASIEDSARAQGAEVVGWSARRRHPYQLFRELEEGTH